MKIQEENDDLFSEDEKEGGKHNNGAMDNDYTGSLLFGEGGVISREGEHIHSSNFDEDGMLVIRHKKNLNIVQDLKTLCLEHEKTSPIENLAIEMNSYKVSQNSCYFDCSMATMLTILETLDITESMTTTKLTSSLKVELQHWKPLFTKTCHGLEEEKYIILTVAQLTCGGGVIGNVLSRRGGSGGGCGDGGSEDEDGKEGGDVVDLDTLQ
eukprot:3073324-Ditylum_brightwellii.AAC.1